MCRKCIRQIKGILPEHNNNNKLLSNSPSRPIHSTLRNTRPIDYWCRKRERHCCHDLFGHHPSVVYNK